MIGCDALTFRYPAQERDALAGVTFDARAGEVTWLTGALGAGTSTLLLTLAGLAPRITGGERHGAVRLDGRDPADASPLAQGIAYLGPAPALQLSGIAKTVRDEVAVGPMNLGWPRDRILERVDDAMARADVTHLATRAPNALSGGETQRVLLAGLVAATPRVYLLDEPFSALDRAHRQGVAAMLRDLARDGACIVIACDDADAMADLADRVVVLREGGVVIDGPPHILLAGDALLDAGATTTDAATLAATAGLPAPRPIGIAPILQRVSPRPVPAAAPSIATATSSTRLAFDDARFRYPNGVDVLRGVTFALRGGEAVGLFGANGAGKSTLLRLAMALEQPNGGAVRTLDASTAGRGPEDLAPRVGFLFQQPERQLFAASVRAECAVAPRLAGWTVERIEEATRCVLEELHLLDVIDEHPYDLPLPRRRLAALAAVLVTDPELLLLDEPTAGLDGHSRDRVAAVVRARAAAGAAVLAITHDAIFAHEALDRGLTLADGRIVSDTAVRDVLDGSVLARPAALAVALRLGLPPGADRRAAVAPLLASP